MKQNGLTYKRRKIILSVNLWLKKLNHEMSSKKKRYTSTNFILFFEYYFTLNLTKLKYFNNKKKKNEFELLRNERKEFESYIHKLKNKCQVVVFFKLF
jgi:hypothetical protein